MELMKKNDLVTVKIEDIGHDGAGIGKDEGFTVFIKDTVIGDVVSARIMKAKSSHAFAKLEKVVSPSSFRVVPKCKIHRQCGGCQLQSFSYDKQLEYKENKVRNHLIRIGGFTPALIASVMEPIIGMEEPFRYRNKAQYPLGYDKAGNLITGFYAGRTHDIIANTDCLLGDVRNQAILEAVLAYLRENKVTAYDEKSGTGLVRHILLRSGFYTEEMMVCFVVNAKKMDEAKKSFIRPQELILALTKIPGMVSISLNLNAERTNVIMGKETHVLWGQDVISDKLHFRDSRHNFADTGRCFTFQISPLSFYQVNPLQAEKLYSLALEYAQLTGKEIVWDLYCGIGTISLFMATAAQKVYGIDMVPEAVHDARLNALNNGIENITFLSGKTEDVLAETYAREGIDADVVIVDPPRKGCDSECLQAIIKMQPKRVIYISCDSATLARDLQILCNDGYQLKRVRAIDQFGQTVHVETICLLEK